MSPAGGGKNRPRSRAKRRQRWGATRSPLRPMVERTLPSLQAPCELGEESKEHTQLWIQLSSDSVKTDRNSPPQCTFARLCPLQIILFKRESFPILGEPVQSRYELACPRIPKYTSDKNSKLGCDRNQGPEEQPNFRSGCLPGPCALS